MTIIKQKKKRIFFYSSILVTLISIISLSLAYASDDELTVGYMQISSHAPMIAALENDIFRKYDLHITKKYYPSTAELISALERGQIDVAFQVTPDFAWRSANKTGKEYFVYFVAQSTAERPMDNFYAMNPISRDDLLGKQIGHFPGSTAKIMLEEILRDEFKLEPVDVKLVEVPPPMQLTWLKNGDISALFTYEPLGALAVNMGGQCILPAPVEKHIINPWSGGVGIFSSDLVKYRKSVAKNFQLAIRDAFSLLERDTDKYITTMMALQPGMSRETAGKVPNISLTFSLSQKESAEIQSSIGKLFKVYKDLGILSERDSHNLRIFNPDEDI